jgi:beta-lactamase class A
VLTILQLVRFSRVRAYFPSGLKIAGVPVGGLDRQAAAERLSSAYNLPVILSYNDAPIQLDPDVIDFQLDLDSMLAAADLQRTEKLFWEDFWDYLWGRDTVIAEVPLVSSFSEERLRVFLENEVAERYDQAPVAARPVVGTVTFQAGQSGTNLDIDGSVLLIENALHSLTQRKVTLPLGRTNPTRPAFANLGVLLRQTVDLAEIENLLVGVYLLDLQTAQELHLVYREGENISVSPDVAFTASSIIKIPIMVSAYRRMDGNRDAESLRLLELMIDKSGNEASDELMNRLIESNRAPLGVTEDMQRLGLVNTFLAGYFYNGAPLLQKIDTPSNSRADINTDPDPYSQTTSTDIGMLLEDIYQCATNGGGALTAIFPGEITQTECRSMIDRLTHNEIGVLIEAGVPDGTLVAHKHGWVSTFGIINTIGDAGIVYTPGGNYIFVVFLHHPDQLVWDPASRLVADLTRAIYNYYNLPSQ